MKGITSIIAVVLLLLITIAIAGFVFLFLLRATESSTSGAQEQLATQKQSIQSRFIIEGVSQNHVYVRNTGNAPLTHIGLYVNNIPVNFTGPSSLDASHLGVYDINNNDISNIPNPSIVKVTSSGWEQQISIALTPSTSPAISAINVSVAQTSAIITWNTDRSSTSLVKYGTSLGSYTNTQTGSDGTSHSVTLTGLSILTTYYFVVNSSDSFGNTGQSLEMNFTTLGAILFSSYTPNNGQSVSNPLIINMSLSPHVNVYNFTLTLNTVNGSINQTYQIPNVLSCDFENIVGSTIKCDNGKNGTMSAPNIQPGKFGQGIMVNGSGTSNPLTFPITDISNSTEGTIIFWMKPNQFPTGATTIIDTMNNSNPARIGGFNVNTTANNFISLCVGYNFSGGSTFCTNSLANTTNIGQGFLNNNTWTFMAITYGQYGGGNSNISVYFGTDNTSSFLTTPLWVSFLGTINTTNSNVYLGSDIDGGRKINATFDNVKIYTKKLLTHELRKILSNESAAIQISASPPPFYSNVSNRQFGSYYLKLNLSVGTYSIRAVANRTNDSTTLSSETRIFTVVP